MDHNERREAPPDPLQILPQELALHVLSFLDSKGLAHAGSVCCAWNIFGNHPRRCFNCSSPLIRLDVQARNDDLWRSLCCYEMKGHVQAVEDVKQRESFHCYRTLYPRLLGASASLAHEPCFNGHRLVQWPTRLTLLAINPTGLPYLEWDERQPIRVTDGGLTAKPTPQCISAMFTSKQALRYDGS
jgi:hypothetical protein